MSKCTKVLYYVYAALQVKKIYSLIGFKINTRIFFYDDTKEAFDPKVESLKGFMLEGL